MTNKSERRSSGQDAWRRTFIVELKRKPIRGPVASLCHSAKTSGQQALLLFLHRTMLLLLLLPLSLSSLIPDPVPMTGHCYTSRTYTVPVPCHNKKSYFDSNPCCYCLYESAILHWVRVSSIKPGNHNVTYWVLRCHSGNIKLNGNDIITWVCGHINWMERVLWFWDQLKLSMINHNTIVESAWEDMRLVN